MRESLEPVSMLPWYNWSFLFKYQKDALRNWIFFFFLLGRIFVQCWGKTLLCSNFFSERTDRQTGARAGNGVGTVSDAAESLQMFLCVPFIFFPLKKWLFIKKCQRKQDAVKFSMVLPYRTSHCQFGDSGG